MDQEEVLADLEKHRLQAEFSSESTLQTVSTLDGGGVTKQTWKRARPLGFGTFGQVWQEAMESEYGDWHYRAVKVCSRAQMRRVGVDYRRELDAFAKLSTSQYSGLFVLFNGWWMDPQNVYLAMEYLGRGDLSKYIIMGLDEIEAREVMENITHGLRVMHQEGFTHRDIKPQNILVVQKRPEFQKWWVKIGDFGISKQISHESATSLHTQIGTRSFCAPEILGILRRHPDTSGYSSKVDMWSLGCVLFSIGTRQPIAFSEPDLVRYCDGVQSFNHRNLAMYLGEDGISLTKKLLLPDPSQRPSAADTLLHPWFSTSPASLFQQPGKLRKSLAESSLSAVENPQSPSPHNYNSFLLPTLSTQSVTNSSKLDGTRQVERQPPLACITIEPTAQLDSEPKVTFSSPDRFARSRAADCKVGQRVRHLETRGNDSSHSSDSSDSIRISESLADRTFGLGGPRLGLPYRRRGEQAKAFQYDGDDSHKSYEVRNRRARYRYDDGSNKIFRPVPIPVPERDTEGYQYSENWPPQDIEILRRRSSPLSPIRERARQRYDDGFSERVRRQSSPDRTTIQRAWQHSDPFEIDNRSIITSRRSSPDLDCDEPIYVGDRPLYPRTSLSDGPVGLGEAALDRQETRFPTSNATGERPFYPRMSLSDGPVGLGEAALAGLETRFPTSNVTGEGNGYYTEDSEGSEFTQSARRAVLPPPRTTIRSLSPKINFAFRHYNKRKIPLPTTRAVITPSRKKEVASPTVSRTTSQDFIPIRERSSDDRKPIEEKRSRRKPPPTPTSNASPSDERKPIEKKVTWRKPPAPTTNASFSDDHKPVDKKWPWRKSAPVPYTSWSALSASRPKLSATNLERLQATYKENDD